jgi:hypothetical protein
VEGSVKRISFVVLLGFLLLCAGLAAAGDNPILGKWDCVATIPGGGEMNLLLNVKQDGKKLAGTISEPDGEFDLVDPKLEKDVFTFRVVLGSGSYDVALKVAGDKLEGSWKGGGETGRVSGSKAK